MHKLQICLWIFAKFIGNVSISTFPQQSIVFFQENSAMAQEYDKYRESSYSQYPTDDKKYECQNRSI